MHQKNKINKILYENHIERWWYLNFSVLFYIIYLIEEAKYWLFACVVLIVFFISIYILDIFLYKKYGKKNGK